MTKNPSIPVYLDVEVNNEDDTNCIVCGDDIDEGDEMTWEPFPEMGERAIVAAHPGCSVRNGFRLRWPS